jgi:type III pantothenate kinase
MNLVIDIGNTNIKAGLFENSLLLEVHRFENKKSFFDYLEEKKDLEIVFSSVGNNKISEQILNNFTKSSQIKINDPLPIKTAYNSSQTLGIDRVIACIGAKKLNLNPCLVVDIGTCITLDVVDETGAFLGGNISPGPKLRFEAMHNFTANLPLVEMSDESSLIGKSTVEALQSGVKFGIIHEIEGMYRKLKQQNSDFKLVLTGGYTSFFDNYIKEGIFAEPNLVLLGLQAIYETNVKK